MKAVLFGLSIVLVSGCSLNLFRQTPEAKKLQFSQTFAEQCVEKEIRSSINKDVDRLRFSKPCTCIAERVSNYISPREMDKFLIEHKITHSLTMGFDKAAYFCVQNVTRPTARFSVGRKK